MSNNVAQPGSQIIGDLRDKEEKNLERAMKTESVKMALSIQLPENDNTDLLKRADDIYRYLEYGSIPMKKEK